MPELGALLSLGKFYYTFRFFFLFLFLFCPSPGPSFFFSLTFLCASCDFFTIFRCYSWLSLFFRFSLFFVFFIFVTWLLLLLGSQVQYAGLPWSKNPPRPAHAHLFFSILWLDFGSFMYFLSKCPKGILLQHRQSRLQLLQKKSHAKNKKVQNNNNKKKGENKEKITQHIFVSFFVLYFCDLQQKLAAEEGKSHAPESSWRTHQGDSCQLFQNTRYPFFPPAPGRFIIISAIPKKKKKLNKIHTQKSVISVKEKRIQRTQKKRNAENMLRVKCSR